MRRPHTTINILQDIHDVADFLSLEMEGSDWPHQQKAAERVMIWSQRMIMWHKSMTRKTGEKANDTT